VLRARIFALLAAIALMLPSGAAARPHYFCKMMDEVLSHCCCSGARSERGSERRAEVRVPGCCEQLVMPARASGSSTADMTVDVPLAGLVAVLPPYELVGASRSVLRSIERQARAPPGLGPPLFIAHCAFLT
jgi:hypothetical protein